MNPNAALKSLNTKRLRIASRPSASVQPSSVAVALLRASALSFWGMGTPREWVRQAMCARRLPTASAAKSASRRCDRLPDVLATRSAAHYVQRIVREVAHALVRQYWLDRRHRDPHPCHVPAVPHLDL